MDSWAPFFAGRPFPTTMSFTTSFLGGGPFGFGTAGFDFVSLRFVDAFGVEGAAGPGPAGMAAGLALPPPPPPQPASTASATAATSIESLRVMVGPAG